MAIMAEFRTAYLQREVAVEATVPSDLKVGQVCTLADGALTVKNTDEPAVGDVIIAQSDMTLGKNRFFDGVDYVDYTARHPFEYSDVVKASTTTKKHLMVFVVTDASDVEYKTV